MREKKIEKQGKEGFRNRTTKINAVRFASGIEISSTVFWEVSFLSVPCWQSAVQAFILIAPIFKQICIVVIHTDS